jgi:hypothetical protein
MNEAKSMAAAAAAGGMSGIGKSIEERKYIASRLIHSSHYLSSARLFKATKALGGFSNGQQCKKSQATCRIFNEYYCDN